MKHMVQGAERSYSEGTDVDIRRIIQELEAKDLQEDLDPEMEYWGNLIPDPGNTRHTCLYTSRPYMFIGF